MNPTKKYKGSIFISILMVLAWLPFSANAACEDGIAQIFVSSVNNNGFISSFCSNNDDGILETFENVQISIIGGGSNIVSATWRDNGTIVHTGGSDPLNNYLFYYLFNTPGTHVITVDVQHEHCSSYGTITLEVLPRVCPMVIAQYVRPTGCLNATDSIQVNLSIPTGGGTIMGSDWTLNNGYTFHKSVNSFYFHASSQGNTLATAMATVLKTDGSTCNTAVFSLVNNIILCDLNLGDSFYSDPQFELQGSFITGQPISVIFKGTNIYPFYATMVYNLLVDGVSVGSFTNLTYDQVFHTIPSLTVGNHTVELRGRSYSSDCQDKMSQPVTIVSAAVPVDPKACLNCNTFAPIVGQKYWVSAWVKENHPTQQKTYLNSSVKIEFLSGSTLLSSQSFTPTGDIIDGWQRIVGAFVVPAGTMDITINLINSQTATIDNYFDDIRIHPFNGSMKSYVYDPVTFWLTAELDDNNYATFYEYDKEGQLIRIKKETARGVMTIQESRSSNPKK